MGALPADVNDLLMDDHFPREGPWVEGGLRGRPTKISMGGIYSVILEKA